MKRKLVYLCTTIIFNIILECVLWLYTKEYKIQKKNKTKQKEKVNCIAYTDTKAICYTHTRIGLDWADLRDGNCQYLWNWYEPFGKWQSSSNCILWINQLWIVFNFDLNLFWTGTGCVLIETAKFREIFWYLQFVPCRGQSPIQERLHRATRILIHIPKHNIIITKLNPMQIQQIQPLNYIQ